MQQARIDLIGADLAFVTNRGSDAPSLLLKAAKRLEPIDADLSRATYLQALSSAMFAGRLALGGGVLEVAARRRGRTAADIPSARIRFSSGWPGGELHQGICGRIATSAEGAGRLRQLRAVEERLRWYWVADIVAATRMG